MLRGNQYGQGFKKGHSGNPSGKPKTIAGMIADGTKNGKRLVEVQLAIMEGKIKAEMMDSDGRKTLRSPTITERQKAIEWLADRGFGKVDQNINGQVSLVNVGLTFPEFRRVLPEPAIDVLPIGETDEIGQKANESVVLPVIEHPETPLPIEKDAPSAIVERQNTENTEQNV